MTLMLGYRKFKETNTALTLTLTDTGDLLTIEPSDYRAATKGIKHLIGTGADPCLLGVSLQIRHHNRQLIPEINKIYSSNFCIRILHKHSLICVQSCILLVFVKQI